MGFNIIETLVYRSKKKQIWELTIFGCGRRKEGRKKQGMGKGYLCV